MAFGSACVLHERFLLLLVIPAKAGIQGFTEA
jgi:hypothetical protein